MHADSYSVHAQEREKAGFLWLWGRKKLAMGCRWITRTEHSTHFPPIIPGEHQQRCRLLDHPAVTRSAALSGKSPKNINAYILFTVSHKHRPRDDLQYHFRPALIYTLQIGQHLSPPQKNDHSTIKNVSRDSQGNNFTYS